MLSQPPSENCSTAIFNFVGHDGNCRCVSTAADCVRGTGLDVHVHRPNVMRAQSTLYLIRHGPGSSFPAGGAEVRLAAARAKANAEAAALVALTDRLVSTRTLEPWEAASISISDGNSWSVPTQLEAGDGRAKVPGCAVLGTCDTPEGTPRYCCFGSSHSGGGPFWSAGVCDARTNGLLHGAATTANGSRPESMPEIMKLLAARGVSLAMSGDSVGDQIYIGAECDWRRHGSCTTMVHPLEPSGFSPSHPLFNKGNPGALPYHYSPSAKKRATVSCGRSPAVNVSFVMQYRPSFGQAGYRALLKDIEGPGGGVLLLNHGAHYQVGQQRRVGSDPTAEAKCRDALPALIAGDDPTSNWTLIKARRVDCEASPGNCTLDLLDGSLECRDAGTMFDFELTGAFQIIREWQQAAPNRIVVWRETLAQHINGEGGEWTLRELETPHSPRRCARELNFTVRSPKQWRDKLAFAVAESAGVKMHVLKACDYTYGQPEAHPRFAAIHGNSSTNVCDPTHYCGNPLLWQPLFNELYKLLKRVLR